MIIGNVGRQEAISMGSTISGIYDFYDDQGAILRSLVPDMRDLPDFVKSAETVGHDAELDQYALVMVDDGTPLRKFATADKGNTWLSALYFSAVRDDLTEDAQKVAAAHLVDACVAFDIDVPDILLEDYTGPVSSNIVSVSGIDPKIKVAESSTEGIEYAIERSDGSKYYPLRDSDDVITAMHYFEMNSGQFVPRERREFAVKVASAAEHMGLPIVGKIEISAQEEWNPSIEGHLTARYLHLDNTGAGIEDKEALMKLSHVREHVGPDVFASALCTFDERMGIDALWDRHIADPWTSTFGIGKIASCDMDADDSFTVGEVTVTAKELKDLATNRIELVEKAFGEEVAEEFAEDPLAQFSAMPLPQKRLIARMASDAQG